MARPVRPEVRYADMEARRYFKSQYADAEKLGFPKESAFAKEMSKGTVSLAPTPEDEGLERVGSFINLLPLIQLRVVQSHYRDAAPVKVKAHKLGMSTHQFKYHRGMFLTALAAYLMR